MGPISQTFLNQCGIFFLSIWLAFGSDNHLPNFFDETDNMFLTTDIHECLPALYQSRGVVFNYEIEKDGEGNTLCVIH